MKRLNLVLVSASAVLLAGCAKTISYKPTLAIPIVNAEMTAADLIGAQPTEIEQVVFKVDGNDTIFTYQLVYTDTLDPLSAADFGVNGSGGVNGGVSKVFDERDVYLRMTGRAESGDFQFTDPIVEYVFINEMKLAFNLELNNTYTKNANTGETFAFGIDNQPVLINAEATTTFRVSNETTIPMGYLTHVFSPTPKYLYYTPKLTTASSSNNVGSGKLKMYSRVILPFTGYGRVSHTDTIAYDGAGFKEQLGDGEDVAGEDPVEFVFLRLKFANEMPLAVKITATVMDTTSSTWTTIGFLPLYDMMKEKYVGANYTIIPGVAEGEKPDSTVTDIRIYADSPQTGVIDLDDLFEGNAIIFKVEFETEGYDQNTPVTIKSDKKLRYSMGLKTKAGGEFDTKAQADSLGIKLPF